MRGDAVKQIRDPRTGEFVVDFNPQTMEVFRLKRGRLIRGKLTNDPPGGYNRDQKPQSG